MSYEDDSCAHPACRLRSRYQTSFEHIGPIPVGVDYYSQFEQKYCSKHMIEHLDFLMQLVAEDDARKKDLSNSTKSKIE